MIGKILLLGNQGQLGWEAQRTLSCLGEVISLDYPQVDFGRPQELAALVEEIAPQVIINAAAYTAVDRAESEPVLARSVNSIAPGVLAEAARKQRALLVHFSTDYVFDGEKGSSYFETDVPRPINVYGQTKLEGDQAVQQTGGMYLIFRTSWVYSMRQGGFVTKVLGWSRTQPVMRVVADQVGSPTGARMLAEITTLVLAQSRGDKDWLEERSGLYHLAGSGAASRLEWARAILDCDPRKTEQVTQRIEPALSSSFQSDALRPAYSALNCDRFEAVFVSIIPPWQQILKFVLEG